MTRFTEKITAQWHDAAIFLLGLWLAGSPWVLAYAEEPTPALIASVFGPVIAIAAAAALMDFQRWEEWVNAAFAAWLIVSPWILGFNGLESATLNYVVVGALVGALALWSALTKSDTSGLAAKS
jgi:SPW repeat